MTAECPLIRFVVHEPYADAVRMLRQALAAEGLSVAAELDVSARIQEQLGAGLASCAVLYVDDPALLLEGAVFQRGAALLIPQPVVVSGSGHRSEVLIRSMRSLRNGGMPSGVEDPMLNLHARILKAAETVGERDGAYRIFAA